MSQEEILISAEDLEFLQDQIQALMAENQQLKESKLGQSDDGAKQDDSQENNDLKELKAKINALVDGQEETEVQKLDKVKHILELNEAKQKEHEETQQLLKDLEQKNNELMKEKIEQKEICSELESQLKQLKANLISQLEVQINSITTSDAYNNGSTGDSAKTGKITLPTEKSSSKEFSEAFEQLWKSREESYTDTQMKISSDEIKNWEEKVSKLKTTLKEKDEKLESLESEISTLKTKQKPLNDKIESLTENESQLRKMLDETNFLSEGYIKRIDELESQRIALATDVAELEEEVSATRKHASERFELARQKQDIESKLKSLQAKYDELRKHCEELEERAKSFKEVADKNQSLQGKVSELSEKVEGLNGQLEKESKEKNDLDQIRELQDRAIRELYDNEKLLKTNIEKSSQEHSEYKMQMDAYKRKTEQFVKELQTQLKRNKKENDRLKDDNQKLIGDVQRLLETINQKKVQEIVTKKEKIIVESMAAHIRELEAAKHDYESKLQEYEKKIKGSKE